MPGDREGSDRGCLEIERGVIEGAWRQRGEFVKMYESELEGPNRRGRLLGRWKDRVEEYLGERGITEESS